MLFNVIEIAILTFIKFLYLFYDDCFITFFVFLTGLKIKHTKIKGIVNRTNDWKNNVNKIISITNN